MEKFAVVVKLSVVTFDLIDLVDLVVTFDLIDDGAVELGVRCRQVLQIPGGWYLT